MNIHDCILLMKQTDQIINKQTIWEHGISVRQHLLKIRNYLISQPSKPDL